MLAHGYRKRDECLSLSKLGLSELYLFYKCSDRAVPLHLNFKIKCTVLVSLNVFLAKILYFYSKFSLYSSEQFCGLINFWPFDGNANDVVGGADMVYGANATFTNDRTGKSLSAIDLNEGYYTLSPGIYFNKCYTVSFWLFLKSFQPLRPSIIDFKSSLENMIICVDSSHALLLITCFLNDCSEYLYSKTILSLRIWYHFSFVLKGNTIFIYVNGALEASSSNQFIPIHMTSLNYLGKSNSDDPNMNGIIDDLKIFDFAMNSSQILKNMNLNLKKVL